MGATEKLNATGSWRLTLRPDTPTSVTDQFPIEEQAFSHLVVLPAWLDPSAVNRATLYALSAYTGVYRHQAGMHELEGAGVAMWLGDEDGKGSIIEAAITKAAGTFVDWVTDLRPTAFLTAGTYHAQPGTLDWSALHLVMREALDHVCDTFAAAWRVNPDLSLDAGTLDQLYGTDPVAMVTPWWTGREAATAAIRCVFEPDQDVEDYNTKTIVVGDGVVGTATNSTPFLSPTGTTLNWERLVEQSDVTADENAVAQGQQNRFTSTRRSIRCTTDEYMPTLTAPVGSKVWAYDPLRRIYNLANQRNFRGDVYWPSIVRLVGASWPFRPGMGLYVIRQSDFGIVDLTPWVAWESGNATLDLDFPGRRLRGGPKLRRGGR